MKTYRALLALLALCATYQDLLGQFTYTNNNAPLTILPYGQPFTFSVTWSGGTSSTGVTVETLNTPVQSIGISANYPNSYTFTYLVSNADATNDGYYALDLYPNGTSGTLFVASIKLEVSPGILRQPQDTVCISGIPTTMGIAAGPSGAAFQWFDAATDTAITSTTNTPLFTPSTTNSGKRIYCKLLNAYGQVFSTNVLLTVNAPTTIATQPSNAFAVLGSSVTFSVSATGTPPLYYQWYKNGYALPGANLDYIMFLAVTNTDAGLYAVIVSNALGLITSSNATLNIGTAVSIVAQPTNVTVLQGEDATFTVSVSGTAPYNYQWSLNNTNVQQATNSTYTINNASLSSAGTYAVVVSNLYGCVVSSNALLSVLVAPTITQQPVGKTVVSGSNASFAVAANAAAMLTYQWTKNGAKLVDGQNVLGSLSNMLVLNPVSTNDSAAYSAIVTDAFGSVTSSVANLLVGIPPQTLNLLYCTNSQITLTMCGTAGFPYVLQASTNISSDSWQSIITSTADSNGVWSFTDNNFFVIPVTNKNGWGTKSHRAYFYRTTTP